MSKLHTFVLQTQALPKRRTLVNIALMHKDEYALTNRRRELYFRVIDGHLDLHAIAQRLHFLEDHFPAHHLESAMRWLIANNITGGHFVRWFKGPCKNSDLEMHRLLLAILENTQLAPVIAGRNFIT